MRWRGSRQGSGSITGRPLLNGLSGTFLIGTIVCPAKIGFAPFIFLRDEETKAERVTAFYSAPSGSWIRTISTEQHHPRTPKLLSQK